MSKQKSFFSTLPGILTGVAALVTAIVGLIYALSEIGLIGSPGNDQTQPVLSAPAQPVAATPKQPATVAPKQPVAVAPKPPVTATPKGSVSIESGAARINLLSPENGGQILAATTDQWLKTVDGEERDFAFYESNLGGKTEAVYAFKDEQPAEFDTFTVLILDTRDSNIKDFELLWGNESPTGKFQSIGKFQTQNIKLFKSPYQEFKFPRVRAKYLKVRLLSTWVYALIDAREFQLWGTLQ